VTVWLYGDSIFRGAALGRFPDLHTPEEIAAEPMWPARAPAEMMNLVLGQDAVRLGGITGLPDKTGKAVRVLARRLNAGLIGPEDVVVFLDVGAHADHDAHEAQWLALRRAVVEEHPVRLIMCEGFDNGAKGRESFRHDLPIGGRSANDALRAAAARPIEGPGRTSLLELSAPIADFHRRIAQDFGASAFRKDGVHLSVLGQMKLCALILAEALPRAPIDPAPLLELVSGRPEAAGAPSPEAARKIVQLAFESRTERPVLAAS
jgi:hypothetical protein